MSIWEKCGKYRLLIALIFVALVFIQWISIQGQIFAINLEDVDSASDPSFQSSDKYDASYSIAPQNPILYIAVFFFSFILLFKNISLVTHLGKSHVSPRSPPL